MRIQLTSVFVDDQEKALRFYTGIQGFVNNTDQPAAEFRWLTVASPEGPFLSTNIQAEYEKLVGRGVKFRSAPVRSEGGTDAVFDDTCGNWIGLHQSKDA